MGFKKDFLWGVATAAYQVEGAAFEDGKGLSVWDVFTRKQGAIHEEQNGDVACDHYHRYKEDIDLMADLGIKAYRFSVSWPRVLPEGIGAINQKGLDFYDRLVDGLLEKGIIPFVTLFHWDFPYELYRKGGWLNPESPDWFAEYTRTVVDRLSDRVKHWITLNEPQCFIGFGHRVGFQAPGLQMGWKEVLEAGHHALLAHGKAVNEIRSRSRQACQVGFAPYCSTRIPCTNRKEDIEAATADMLTLSMEDNTLHTWWMDPVYLGSYPEEGLKLFEEYLPVIGPEDMKIISQSLDYFGVNIYWGSVVENKDGKAVPVPKETGVLRTAFNWEVRPEAMYWGPKFFYERYKKPVIIMENGISNLDWVSLDGKVHDPQRIDFLHRYLLELQKASENGVDVAGYFQWSLMDNFEWSSGYNERFGLIHVDYQTQKRTVKDSGYWYKKVIESNGENL